MSQCLLCGAETSTFSQKKISNGVICKNCSDKLPKVMKNNTLKYSKENLETILNYNENLNKDIFQATASYGKLHIDELHGLFAISDKLDENDQPIDKTDIFYCLDLRDVGITPTNPTASGTKVLIDVELHCWFDYPNLSFKTTIKNKVPCLTKQVKKDGKIYLDYDTPGDLTMFINMFNQMIQTAQEKYQQQFEPKFASKYTLDIFKAQTLFMLADGYTLDIINSQRDRLMKSFHDIPECSKIIDNAYNLLIESLF